MKTIIPKWKLAHPDWFGPPDRSPEVAEKVWKIAKAFVREWYKLRNEPRIVAIQALILSDR